jgi:chromosome segregation ATPase
MGLWIDTTIEIESSSRRVKSDGKKLNGNYKGALYRNTVLEKALQDANTCKKDAEAKSSALQSEVRSHETALQVVESEHEAVEIENSSLKTRIDKLNKRVENFSGYYGPALRAENTALRL